MLANGKKYLYHIAFVIEIDAFRSSIDKKKPMFFRFPITHIYN